MQLHKSLSLAFFVSGISVASARISAERALQTTMAPPTTVGVTTTGFGSGSTTAAPGTGGTTTAQGTGFTTAAPGTGGTTAAPGTGGTTGAPGTSEPTMPDGWTLPDDTGAATTAVAGTGATTTGSATTQGIVPATAAVGTSATTTSMAAGGEVSATTTVPSWFNGDGDGEVPESAEPTNASMSALVSSWTAVLFAGAYYAAW